jgi:hypothetical protein
VSPLLVATTDENAAVLQRVPVLPVLLVEFELMKIPFRLPVALMLKSHVAAFVIARPLAAPSVHATRVPSV